MVAAMLAVVMSAGLLVFGRPLRPQIDSLSALERVEALSSVSDTGILHRIAVEDRDPMVRARAWGWLSHFHDRTNQLPLSVVKRVCYEEPVDSVVERLAGEVPRNLFRFPPPDLDVRDKIGMQEWLLAEEEWRCIPACLQTDTNALLILSERAPSPYVRWEALRRLEQ
jgi:hypothetical protein